jgi:hypothetical protein
VENSLNRLIQLIEKIISQRLRGSITIHFDGLGGIAPEIDVKLKNEEIYKLLTNKKE